ncbi:type II toxin-antitoxin system CcdA family antitoxin [Bacteroides heparinolyticus]|uniref:type II toxin-antitoxin system CcdA family antitoxin n=1 Tax=Prevotella heparinolytica TaxID=28113 RepID=UPI0035A04DB6
MDMKEYVKNYEHRTVRKNVTIPSYLNEMAKNNNINVSAVLQKALIEELGLDE